MISPALVRNMHGQMWPLIPVEARSLQVSPESVER